MDTLEQINHQINNIFASNDVTVSGPGTEAFWNAVEEVDKVNPTAARELAVLSTQWLAASGGTQC